MTLQQRVTGPVVRPVFAGLLDFKNDPVTAWTGPGVFAPSGTGDPDLDNNTFAPAEGAADISDFLESTSGGGTVRITYSAHDNDAETMRQIVKDRRVWRLRKAKLWLFFLMDDEATVHPEFKQLFSGVIAQAATGRQLGRPSTIVLDLDVDLQNAAGPVLRWTDHARENSGDTFSTFIDDLAKGPIAGAAAAAGGPRGRSGGGANRQGNLLIRPV